MKNVASQDGTAGLASTAYPLSRRQFIRGAAAVASTCMLGITSRSVASALTEDRRLSLHHLHTGEDLSIVYYTSGIYLPRALERLKYYLRDHRTGEVHEIDPELLDILYQITSRTRSQRPFDVVSGYRSPTTNAMLRRRRRGVARNSLHMFGRAIDVRLGDVHPATVRDTAIRLARGGVGYYGRSGFVHLDTGRFRTW